MIHPGYGDANGRNREIERKSWIFQEWAAHQRETILVIEYLIKVVGEVV
jgi:hypothetical protein